MEMIPKMVDMARTVAEKSEAAQDMLSSPVANIPDYPYGLSISFGKDEIEKLGLEGDVQVGDYLHIHALAKVTSVSMPAGDDRNCRVEATLTHIACEDEDEENEVAEEEYEPTPVKARKSKMYQRG